MSKFLVLTLFTIISISNVSSVDLVAYISQNGLHGEIHFRRYDKTMVEIRADLETTLQYPEQAWNWGIHNFPVDYTDTDPSSRCDIEKIGENIINFDDDLGYLTLPGNETSKWYKEMNITGDNGLWGKSVVLSNPDNKFRICATITTVDQTLEHLAEATFHTPVFGSVYFRWLASTKTDHSDTLIFANLFHIKKANGTTKFKPFTEHFWKIYVTDIFKHDHHRTEENCNFLQQIFDPQGYGEGKSLGDLDVRNGKMKIATNPLKQQHPVAYRDEKLVLLPSDLTIPHRTLYLVMFDNIHHNDFIACSKIRHIKPTMFKSFLNQDGLKGEISFSQRSKFDPTFLNITIGSASNTTKDNLQYAKDIASIRINELPPSTTQKANNNEYCSTTKGLFNPIGLEKPTIPPPGFGTQDQYPVGDLTGKLQSRSKSYFHNYILPGASSELNGIYWDVFLPLRGPQSISHRGLVLYKYNRTDTANLTEIEWACGTVVEYEKNGIYQKPMHTAKILFRYPVVGQILMRQPKEEPWQDTTILFEYVIHADGSTQNNSDSHRWAIHVDPPGKDFYNWSDRCLSSGEVFNPYKVDFDTKSPEDTCKSSLPGLCRMGDLFNRLGLISIAGSRHNGPKISRKLFTDSNLPLSGTHNIIGKSLVLFDDFGPKARGERLACSIIGGHFRRKAVAKDWYANGAPLTAKGKIEIVQQSEYELSNVEVELKGLVKNSGYHIHMTPVEGNLEFPCEDLSLYGHFNPRNVDPKLSPPPAKGSTDQYELGDLSGKFGTLDGLTQYDGTYNDTNLPLFGYESIIGRSIVIHKKDRNLRWACSTLERGYSPSEAREIRSIASFHHPAGYAYGYMRMTQLIHNDGGASDTIIEVKLRHPGVNDRNLTRNHHFQIFVNPVGVDATVKQTVTRCVAGGYVWNPFYTQLADPLNGDLYRQECAPDNPLRCFVGDVSARTGTIDLGDKRVLLTDSNFPLEGQQSAVGRSIVIFGPERSGERYACANIEPDHDIVKYINLEKPPKFVVAQFLEDIRHVMGLPEWMLEIDARQTKTLHNNACVQMLMHFRGPQAHQLELDFSRLLATGRLDQPTISIPGYVNQKRKVKISYRTCGVTDPNEKKSKRRKSSSNSYKIGKPNLLISILAVILFSNLLLI